jgi:uncharacterized protein (DUF1015 family)
MATILPFRAIRPQADKVHLVASRSVDGYITADLKDKLAGNPFTFLHIINPDFEDGLKTRPGSKERLQKIKRRFNSFIKDNIFLKEEKPTYYIYRQIKENYTYTGIIACTAIDDYTNGTIKIHEQTITSREEKLKEYLDVCEFNAEPVLFCYPDNKIIDDLIHVSILERPVYDFTTTDRVRHTLWSVSDKENVNVIKQQFKDMPAIYIADGHHRSASSALYGKTKRANKKTYYGNEAFNFYLGAFFPETQLRIVEYNRIVKDLNGLSDDDFLNKIAEKFEIKSVHSEIFIPEKKHQLGMYFRDKWFALNAKNGTYNSNDPVGSLDAAILTTHVLSPILNIHDLKTDKRIAFVPGIKGSKELKNLVDSGKAEVAFALFPVEMNHLKWIADTNNIMPPKSTWVEPKMRSGLVIFNLEEENVS